MDLHPKELGRLRLHVALEDGRVDVQFIVQNEGAKQALDQQVEMMRTRFEEMGVTLGQFDVRRDGGSSQHEPPTESERLPQLFQSGRSVGGPHRKAYGPIANPLALVDVIA